MRWIKSSRSAGVPPAVRSASRAPSLPRGGLFLIFVFILTLIAAILTGAILLSAAPPERHLAVYSVAANYSLPLIQREGRTYVGLLEVLEPLGKVSAKSEGLRWRLRYNNSAEGVFQIGKTHARVQGR